MIIEVVSKPFNHPIVAIAESERVIADPVGVFQTHPIIALTLPGFLFRKADCGGSRLTRTYQ